MSYLRALSYFRAEPGIQAACAKLSVLLLLLSSLFCTTAHAIDKIEVQGLFASRAVLSIDGTMRMLKVGEVSPEGVRLISADSTAAVLEIDGARKEYALGNTVSTQFTQRTERKQRLHRDPSSGMYFARGRINGQPVKFMVDTGATSIAMSTSQAKQLGIRYQLIGSPTRVRTASGDADAYSVNLRTVNVGEISQSNIEALVVEGKPDGPILLGMSFLGRLGVEQTRTVMTLIQK